MGIWFIEFFAKKRENRMCKDQELICPGCNHLATPTTEEINKALACAESETTCGYCGLVFRFCAGNELMFGVLD